jgi:hypothetical protein
MESIVIEALQRVSHMVEETHAEIILPKSWPAASGYGPCGTVLVESELGYGSVFGFALPAVHQDHFDEDGWE